MKAKEKKSYHVHGMDPEVVKQIKIGAANLDLTVAELLKYVINQSIFTTRTSMIWRPNVENGDEMEWDVVLTQKDHIARSTRYEDGSWSEEFLILDEHPQGQNILIRVYYHEQEGGEFYPSQMLVTVRHDQEELYYINADDALGVPGVYPLTPVAGHTVRLHMTPKFITYLKVLSKQGVV